MQPHKKKAHPVLVWMRRVAEVAGVLSSIFVAGQAIIDFAVKVLNLLRY